MSPSRVGGVGEHTSAIQPESYYVVTQYAGQAGSQPDTRESYSIW